LEARTFEAAGLKAESGLVVLRKMRLPGEGVEFDAPADFRLPVTAAEREAARVAANLVNVSPASLQWRQLRPADFERRLGAGFIPG
jgi:hypothetical protein